MTLRKLTKGFTIMELLVALAILGILTAIAIPAYKGYNLKARRADGLHAVLAIQLAEEKYRTHNTQYGDLTQVWGGNTASPAGHYTLAISAVGASSYTVTASAAGAQTNDTENGTACSTLTLTYSNGTTIKTPTDCWGN